VSRKRMMLDSGTGTVENRFIIFPKGVDLTLRRAQP